MALFRRLRPHWTTRVVRTDRPVVPAARTGTADPAPASLDPAAVPGYFGPVPNFADSPRPVRDPQGRVVTGTGLRKFVDALPVPGPAGRTELGGHLPVATPDTVSWPGCDYYEIGLSEYTQRLHRDLPTTRLRGYRQLNLGTDPDGHNTVAPPERPYHLGPLIMARRGRPVRIKFINQLPTGRAGDLFLPVDTSLPGAGPGPLEGPAPYPQNRAVPQLSGAHTGWISAGNPWQWVTPAGEITPYPTGPGLTHVPDMPPPGAGATTLYYPNAQSGRLMCLQDNTLGLSRLTVLSGQFALYLLTDPVEDELVADGVLPADQLPLVIQDRTFVPDDAQLAAEDPTWDRERWGTRGNLWHPHVYQPRQDPYRDCGRNPTGRWDYGPWLPGADGRDAPRVGPVDNPHHDPEAAPQEPPRAPGTPHPSAVPEAYGDTMLVNGVAYPYLRVRPTAYRFRIVNGCADRALNLQLYRARADGPMWQADGSLADADAGEVPMVDAGRAPGRPADWPTDGRDGGVPDPAAAGPPMIQIGNECGLLPAPVVVPNRPVGYRYDRRDPTVLNVDSAALLLAPGERADVVVDFSTLPPGATVLLYNDCPAPLPGGDPRYDRHSAAGDGGSGSLPGYGPNTRTLLQFRVTGTPTGRYDPDRLADRLPAAYAASQRPPIVPQREYDRAFGTTTARGVVAPAHATSVTFTPPGATGPVTLPIQVKTVGTVFEPEYGRRAGRLGVPHPTAGPLGPVTLPLGPTAPATEILVAADPTAGADEPADGIQLWRISGTGRQTHPVRFDGCDVQVVHRIGGDGTVRAPDGGELGWKQTVRVNPAEELVVALRPEVPPLPFKVADSRRLLDPTRPAGVRLDAAPVSPWDGRPATVVNQQVNLGWEFRWSSAAAGLRDLGMSRPLVLRVSPRAPTGLTATPVPGSATALPAIALAWTGNGSRPAATSHLLQRATDADFGTGLTTITVAGTATRYTDATITPGVTYHYRIRAENAAGCSTWSNSSPASVRLPAPSGLAATVPPATPLRVALRWVNRSFATGLDVQRATNPTFTSGPGTTAVPVADRHLDPAVAPDTTYYYRVRTTYLGTASPWSTVATVTTPPVPEVPNGVAATVAVPAPDTATVSVTWAASLPAGPGAGFVVQRAVDPQFGREVVNFTVAGRSFTNTGLDRDVTYHYRVRAFNVVGHSPWTGPVSVHIPH
ncbi:hypothetical protein [Micromonospora matsumotoense]|uniref:hypothetical protein n=1 Tax=Micromonospora matsumotoense TaxID=121616 RepID=UPI0033F166F9